MISPQAIQSLVKGALAVGAAVAAYLVADKAVEKKTGKRIHEHVSEWWTRLHEKARKLLDKHPELDRIVVSTRQIAAAKAAAAMRLSNAVKVKLYGQERGVSERKVVSEEDVPLGRIDDFYETAKQNPVLAMAA